MPDGDGEDMDGGVSVEAILRAFNAPINEEQAWAICFQTLRHLTGPLPPQVTIKHLHLCRDGAVLVKPAPTEHDASEKDFLTSLGRLLYDALDFGLSETEERVLDPHLEAFIVMLTTKEDEGSSDEGIENDEEDSASHIQLPLTRTSVLQICSSHLPPKTQPDVHFKAVCRALYVEYEELCAFLTQVSRGTSELKKVRREVHISSLDRHSTALELENLKSADWARLWMQVIRQLRNGVKLRKVDSDCQLSRSEFELTPYEMLLNDIRLRRYKLKHVDFSDELHTHPVKRDAHDLILEFIRSRPPLVPVSRRVTPPTPEKEDTMYERLMKSIRVGHQLRHVSTSCPQNSPTLGRVITDLSDRRPVSLSLTPSPRKRCIKPDLDFSSIASDDEEDNFTRVPYQQGNVQEVNVNQKRSREISTIKSSESSTTKSVKQNDAHDSRDEMNSPFSLTIFFRSFARYLNLTQKSQQKRHSVTQLRHMCDTITEDEYFSDS